MKPEPTPDGEQGARAVRSTLLYDADCGFCTKAVGFVPRLRLDVHVVSLQSVDLEALNVSTERAVAEMPFVRSDGSVCYGHEAIAAALRTGPVPVRVLGRLLGSPMIGPVAGPVYRWVARHRHQLPGGTPACALPADDPHTSACVTRCYSHPAGSGRP